MKYESEITLVVGGTGKTGRRVADRLRRAGQAVRVASRRGSPAFDWSAPETWPAALAGARAMYLTFYPDLAVPGAADAIAELSRQAVASGVERIVLLSGRGEPQVLPSEQAVRESGASFTILRCAWFAQNFSEGHLADAVQRGELAFPAGNVAEPFLDAEDIADVAVAALRDERHAGKIYELTGPRLLTFGEAMLEIGRAAGRSIRYVPVTKQAYAEMLAPYVAAEEVAFLSDLFEYVLDGHNAHVTSGVEQVLGRKARDFGEYARAAAASGAWALPRRGEQRETA